MQKSPRTSPALANATARASTLIELMLKEMQRGLKDQLRLESAEWERLFGNKQSMVANLLKLVQSLCTLRDTVNKQSKEHVAHREVLPLDAQELAMLTAWLAQEGAPPHDQ